MSTTHDEDLLARSRAEWDEDMEAIHALSAEPGEPGEVSTVEEVHFHRTDLDALINKLIAFRDKLPAEAPVEPENSSPEWLEAMIEEAADLSALDFGEDESND